MKKVISIFCTALLAASLTSCGNHDRGDGSGHMFNVALQGNPQSLDPQFSSDPSSATVIKNLYSGLMAADKDGNISCCNARSYDVSDDGTVYTFRLRKDNYWFFDENNDDVIDEDEYFPVTAQDYVFALQRLLDPKMQSPYARYFTCIKNGKSILNGSSSPDSAGIRAVNDLTLEITLEYPSAELLELLTTPASYPCNEEFFLSTKGRYGLDDRSVMSNGPFYVRQWFYDPYGVNNILYMGTNTVNENASYEVLPTYVSFSIEKTAEDIRQCFKDEETECFTSLSSSGYNPKKYLVQGQRATTLGLVFNSADKTFSNLNMRKALACSIDREALSDQLSSDITPAYGIIPPAVDMLGRSYRELSSDKQFSCFDIEEAKNCLENAKKELGINSVSSVKILVNSETVNSGYLHLLSQSWQDTLGIYIGIEDVTAGEFYERVESGDYTIALYPLSGNISSGLAFIDRYETTPCLGGASDSDSFSESIKRCPTASGLVEAYTSAERDILSEFSFIPVFYKNSYLIADRDNEDIIYDPFTGSLDFRIAKNYS